MHCASPVVVGLGVPEGATNMVSLPALISPVGTVVSRWEPSEEERERIASGYDIFLTLYCGGHAYPPTQIDVIHKDRGADYFKAVLNLDDALALKILQEDLQRAQSALAAKVREINEKMCPKG